MSTNMTFIDFVTPVPADWLNNVNTVVNGLGSLSHLSIEAFGGKGDGVFDNTTALNNALSSALQSPGRVIIYFPPGKFVFKSTITYTFPTTSAAISIYGAGSDVTELSWQGNVTGIIFNYLGAFNSVKLSGLSVTTNTTNTATAIYLNQTNATILNPANSATNVFFDLVFRGADGYLVTNTWINAIYVFGVSAINFINCTFVGNNTSAAGQGVTTTGPSSSCQAVGFNFTNCFFNFLDIGTVYSQWSQGHSYNACNFTGCQIGIQVPIDAGGQDELVVTNSQINCGIAGIQANQPTPVMMIAANLFIIPTTNSRGITCTNYSTFQIVGNFFGGGVGPTGTIGIYLNNKIGVAGGTITGNNFYELSTGIDLDTGSGNVNVQSNSYLSNTTNVSNSGSGNTIGGGSA